jgi:hypothetical protein
MIRRFPAKPFVYIAAAAAVAAAAVFVFRYQIIRSSADAAIRKLLPDYVKVDDINFDIRDGRITVSGFRIVNPPGFSDRYLIEIRSVSCGYKMRGSNILDGFDMLEPVFTGPVLNIERLPDGRVNLQEMKRVIDKEPVRPAPAAGTAVKPESNEQKAASARRLPDVLKLPGSYRVKDGKLVFKDHLVRPGPYIITFEDIDSTLSLELDPAYTYVVKASSDGSGDLNGKPGETIKWRVVLDPTTPGLSMSNRFDIVSGIDIKTFEPYYDRYSPFIFHKGRFSGTLVFDFDNGSIGSTNEIRLSGISFAVKKGMEQSAFLETTVPDLVRYFTSSTGDIIFDFKIKGEMSDPKFHLGPISKQALTSMAIDKVSVAIVEAARSQQAASGQDAGGSQYDKAKAIIDAFKGIVDNK